MKMIRVFCMITLFWNGYVLYGSENDARAKKVTEQEGTLSSLLNQAQNFRIKAEELNAQVKNKNNKKQNTMQVDINKEKNALLFVCNKPLRVQGDTSTMLAQGDNSTIIGYIPSENGRLLFLRATNSFIEATVVRNVKKIDIEFSEGSHSNNAVIHLSPFSDTRISAKTIQYKIGTPVNQITIYSWYKPMVDAIGGVTIDVRFPLHYLLIPSVFAAIIGWLLFFKK